MLAANLGRSTNQTRFNRDSLWGLFLWLSKTDGFFYNIPERDYRDAVENLPMALQLKVETLEGLSEDVQSHYIADGAGFKLDCDAEDVSGLKATLQKFKDSTASLKADNAKLKPFESLIDLEGFDPSKAQELMTKAASAGDPKAIEQMQRLHEAAMAKRDGELKELKTSVDLVTADKNNYILKDQITRDVISSGVDPDNVDDVVRLNLNGFGFSDDNAIRALDKDGFAVGSTPSEFFTGDYKTSKPQYYAASDITGSGSRGAKAPTQNKDMTATQKIAAGLNE